MNQPVYRFLAFAFVLIVGLVYFVQNYSDEAEPTPCSPGALPSRCYQISKKMCETVWSTTEASCQEYLKKFNLTPGRLVGPIVFRCQWAYLDNAFAGARNPTPECKQLFSELKAWESRNDFK
jgi:hypothetical protein